VIRALFLDTSGWLAALLPEQTGHAKAREAYRAVVAGRKAVLTSNLVVAETHSLLLRYRDSSSAMEFYDDVMRDPLHEIVHVDAELERDAVEQWMRPRAGHAFSLCDVVSFELMRREKITRALTFDRHFGAAGFQILR
jgi:predicted nucleic acid-binding protein